MRLDSVRVRVRVRLDSVRVRVWGQGLGLKIKNCQQNEKKDFFRAKKATFFPYICLMFEFRRKTSGG